MRHALERSHWRNYLDHMAHHDSLTKLPNRTLFQDRLGQALEQARRNKKGLAVLFLDLDHFKSVNDTMGHTVGDMLLECVAERLRSSVRASDTVARVGGDEFTLLLPDIGGVDDVVLIADKILSGLRTPFLIGPHQVAAEDDRASPFLLRIGPLDRTSKGSLLILDGTSKGDVKRVTLDS